MGQDQSKVLQRQLFDLRFAAKSLNRNAKKSEKNEKAQKKKCKTAIEKGNIAGAKIYAQNAIREKNQALKYMQLASRIDAVAARVNTAVTMGQLTKTMGGVVHGMDVALQSMNVERIGKIMDKFEQQFEDLDVRSAYMEGTMDNTTSLSTPEDQVTELMSQVADEHGLSLAGQLDDAGLVSETAPQVQQEVAAAPSTENALAARLAALHK